MTVPAARRTQPIEQTTDPSFSRRVQRLGIVSLVVPGVIWWLAATRLLLPQSLLNALLAGWWLMPAILFASLPVPSLRPLLIVPATLITVPVLAIAVGQAAGEPVARLGWWLIAAGLLIGGVMGGWFWFRWAPVPSALDSPFAPARWALIAVHVTLIATGLLFAALG